MAEKLPPLSLKFVTLLLLLAGLGLSLGLSLERQLYQKQAEENVSAPADCQAAEPATPTNFRGWSGPNEGEVSLVWDQVENVTDYQINYSPAAAISATEITGLHQQQSYTVSGLTAGEDYYFTIAAVNGCVMSPASAILTITAYAEGVTQNIVYLPVATVAPELTPDESSIDESEATPAAESEATETVEATPAAAPAEPENKSFSPQDLFRGTLPWVMAALIVWGIVVLVKLRLKILAKESGSLEQGTEIPIPTPPRDEVAEAEPPLTTETETFDAPQADDNSRPAVEPPDTNSETV